MQLSKTNHTIDGEKFFMNYCIANILSVVIFCLLLQAFPFLPVVRCAIIFWYAVTSREQRFDYSETTGCALDINLWALDP